MADARSPDWRNIGDEAPAPVPANRRAWQPGDEDPATPSSKRNLKRGAALLALVTILVGIGWVLVWLRPPKPACLVAIGSGYEHNLLLPHNAPGWHGLLRLFSHEQITPKAPFFPWGQPTGMRKAAEPVELEKQSWKQMWQNLKVASSEEKTVAVFLSLHGLAEGDDVYLLPNVDSLDAFNAARISFKDVLESLNSVRDKNVVLFLDLGQLQSNWPTGTLDNDFVDGLQSKYKKEIEERGNLVVICSAGPHQRSWASDELQNSVFTHFVTEGLQGAALDGDKGVITAKKLFGYVADQVEKWVQTNRARSQKPVMLGSTSAAEKIDLVYITTPYIADPNQAPESKLSLKDVESEWQAWEALKDVAPYVHHPHLWRHYQESLVRYEQLQRCGAARQADQLKDNLQRLRTAIKNAQTLDAATQCLGNSFPVRQVMGFPAIQKPSAIERLFDKLRNSKDDEETKKLLDPYRKSTQDAEFLQVELGRLMLEKPGDLGENRQWLAQLETDLGLALRPIEVQWQKMLKDVDAGMGKDALTLALEVRVLAEEAALNPQKGSGQSYSEVVHRWIKKDVDDADALRRQGEDLLFGTPSSHREQALKLLREAKSKYDEARAQAKQRRHALAKRDEVLAELPYLAHWLALAPAGGDTMEQTVDLRQQITTMGEDLEKLVSTLNPEKPATAVGALTKLAAKVAATHEKMANKYKELASQLPEVATQKNWHELDHALSIPYADAATRMKLLQKLQSVARDIRKGTGQVEAEEVVKSRVLRQQKILLACLAPFRAQVGEPNLDKANLREFYLKVTEKITEQAKARADKLPLLQEAAGLCRLIPAALVKDVPGDPFHPVERLRRLRTHQLLLWQAERAWQDHWFDGDTPYYLPIAKAYVDCAQKLIKDDRHSQDFAGRGVEFEKQKLVVARLAILGEKKKQAWTTEVNFPLPWRLANDGELPEGKPMVWLEVGDATKAAAPIVRKELSWPKDNHTAPFVSLNELEFWKNKTATRNTAAFHAVYRGQYLRSDTLIERPKVEVKVKHPAPPNSGALAVRMDSSFNYGAISIILDNSGSMRWVPGKDNEFPKDGKPARFDFALAAMRDVLNKIPDSTYLSVLRFTTDKKDDRKTDVEFLRPTTAWQKAGTQFRVLDSDLEAMNKDKDRYLNFASPIARAIARSKQDGFPADYAGPRVILVLTDGSDTVSKNVPEELQNAGVDKAGIDVVIVCFIDPDADEFQTAEKQFGGIKKFTPASNLSAVKEGEKLGAKLLEALYPGLQLTDKLSGGEPSLKEVGVDVPKWSPLAPRQYLGQISRSDSAAVEMLVNRGDNLFVIARRANRKFILERGLLGEQAEAKQFPHVERGNWLVSLLSKKTYNNKLDAQFLFEQRRTQEAKIQQHYPGFVWLEAEPIGKKLEGELIWETDWHVAAPAFRIEAPFWPMTEPLAERFAAWFWPENRDDFLKHDFVKSITLPIPSTLDVAKSGLPSVQSVEWDQAAKKLMVRAAYEPGKPVMIALRDASPRMSVEHHYYHQSGRVTAYFDGFTERPAQADLWFIDVDRFKQAKVTQNLVFSTQNHRPIEPTTHFLRPKHLLP